MSNHGGKRPGAGRKPGAKGVRTIAATELVREAQERFPDYNPLSALIALAKDAEKAGDVETARQCHAAVLPYTAPRFRPVECDPEAALAYEERLAEIRGRHTAAALKQGLGVVGLAERLERMQQRKAGEGRYDFALPVAPAAIAPTVIDAEPAEPEPTPEKPSANAGPTYSAPDPTPLADAALIAASLPAYSPMIPWPSAPAQADAEYDVLGAYGLKD